jgi:hypothetical protein
MEWRTAKMATTPMSRGMTCLFSIDVQTEFKFEIVWDFKHIFFGIFLELKWGATVYWYKKVVRKVPKMCI